MKSAILTSDSNKNLKMLVELAQQLGIKAKILTNEEVEDIGLAIAIKNGKTGDFINTDEFIANLK